MKSSFQKVFFTLLLAAGFSVFSYAQSVDAAGTALNEAIEFKKAKQYGKAAEAFEKALNIASMAGPDAFSIQASAEKQLPLMYFYDAVSTYKAKDYIKAIEKFKKAANAGEKYNNPGITEKAGRNVTALNNSLGNSFRKKKEFDKALGYFNDAIEFDPGYAKAYLGKMLVYKDLGQDQKMIEMADKINSIEPDSKTASSANGLIQTYYLKDAKLAHDSKKKAQAVESIESYLNYGIPTTQGLYMASVIYNANDQFQKSIEMVNKALAKASDKKMIGNLYFELGNAHKGLNNVEQACSAYSKALDGPNGESAKYQMEEVIGCK
ncbi:MAG TPA: hypothetical protein VJ939_08175 [Bacteroidales bacterium]|nr:hypothetical protein [Bacteroidales bacterium]